MFQPSIFNTISRHSKTLVAMGVAALTYTLGLKEAAADVIFEDMSFFEDAHTQIVDPALSNNLLFDASQRTDQVMKCFEAFLVDFEIHDEAAVKLFFDQLQTLPENFNLDLKDRAEELLAQQGLLLDAEIVQAKFDQEHGQRLLRRLKLLEDAIIEDLPISQLTNPIENLIIDVTYRLELLLDPEPMLTIPLTNTSVPAELRIMKSNQINVIPKPGEHFDLRVAGMAGLVAFEAKHNFAASLDFDDRQTRDINEALARIGEKFVDQYYPKHPKLLDPLGIADPRNLTPGQFFRLNSYTSMQLIDYSNPHAHLDENGKGFLDLSMRVYYERETNDALPIEVIPDFDTSLDGNGVCRTSEADCVGRGEGMKEAQLSSTLISNCYVVPQFIHFQNRFPGHERGHAWPTMQLFHVDGSKLIIYATIHDPSEADELGGLNSEYKDRLLDRSKERYPPLLRRYENFIDPETCINEMLEAVKDKRIAPRLMYEYAIRLYKELPNQPRETIFPRLEAIYEELRLEEEDCDNFRGIKASPLKKDDRHQIEVHPIAEQSEAAMVKRLGKIREKHPELFRSNPKFCLEEGDQLDFLYLKGLIAVSEKWEEQEIINRLRLHNNFYLSLIEIQNACYGKLMLKPLVKDDEWALPGFDLKKDKVGDLEYNLRLFFTNDARQSLLRYRSVWIPDNSASVHYSRYAIHLSVDDFLDDFDPDALDSKLEQNNVEAHRQYVETLRLRRALENSEVYNDPRLYGIQITEESANPEQVFEMLGCVLHSLDDQESEVLKRRPLGISIVSSEEGACLVSSLKNREKTKSYEKRGSKLGIDIRISGDHENFEVEFIKALKLYIKLQMLREEAQDLGVNVCIESTNGQALNEQSCRALEMLVDDLRPHQKLFRKFKTFELGFEDSGEVIYIKDGDDAFDLNEEVHGSVEKAVRILKNSMKSK